MLYEYTVTVQYPDGVIDCFVLEAADDDHARTEAEADGGKCLNVTKGEPMGYGVD